MKKPDDRCDWLAVCSCVCVCLCDTGVRALVRWLCAEYRRDCTALEHLSIDGCLFGLLCKNAALIYRCSGKYICCCLWCSSIGQRFVYVHGWLVDAMRASVVLWIVVECKPFVWRACLMPIRPELRASIGWRCIGHWDSIRRLSLKLMRINICFTSFCCLPAKCSSGDRCDRMSSNTLAG